MRRQFRPNHSCLQSRQLLRHRRRPAILSMAAVRHRARVQHLEFVRQPAAAGGDRRIPQRALRWSLSIMKRAIEIDTSKIWLRVRHSLSGLLQGSQRYRGDRICRDRSDHAGDVLRHRRIFVRRGDRSQGHADGACACGSDVSIGRRSTTADHSQFPRGKRRDHAPYCRRYIPRRIPRFPSCISIRERQRARPMEPRNPSLERTVGTSVTIPASLISRDRADEHHHSPISI